MADPTSPAPAPPTSLPRTLLGLPAPGQSSWLDAILDRISRAAIPDPNDALSQQLAERERQRAAFRRGDSLPEPLKGVYQRTGAALAKPIEKYGPLAENWIRDQLGSSVVPGGEALRTAGHAAVAPRYLTPENAPALGNAPIGSALRGLSNVQPWLADQAIDQAANATTPGDMALNAIPEAKVAALFGKLAHTPLVAGSTKWEDLNHTIGGIPSFNSLAKGLRQTGDAIHDLHPSVSRRLNYAEKIARDLPPEELSDWRGANDPQLVQQGFGGRLDLANLYGDIWGAASPSTSAADSTREAAGIFAHMQEYPHRPLPILHYGDFSRYSEGPNKGQLYRPNPQVHLYPELAPGNSLIKNAGSKIYNINDLLYGLPMDPITSPKASEMGAFLRAAQGNRNRGMLDIHFMYGQGGHSPAFAPHFPELREYFKNTEGLADEQLAAEAGQALMYGRVRDALVRSIERRAADLGEDYNPVYGRTWAGLRKLKGLKYEGGPNDILRARGLNLNNAMLDLDRLKYEYATPPFYWRGTPLGMTPPHNRYRTMRPSTSRPSYPKRIPPEHLIVHDWEE